MLRPRRRVDSPLRTAEAPLAAFRRLEREAVLPDPPTPEELRRLFMIDGQTRKVFHYGIEFRSIQYHGEPLKDLIKRKGSGITLRVMYDPSDVRAIAVEDPDTGEYFTVSAKDKYMPAVSFAFADTIDRKGERLPLTAKAVLLAVQAAGLVEAKGGKATRGKRREHGRRTADQVIRKSAAAPVVDAAPTAPSAPTPQVVERRRIVQAAPVSTTKRKAP